MNIMHERSAIICLEFKKSKLSFFFKAGNRYIKRIEFYMILCGSIFTARTYFIAVAFLSIKSN